MFPPRLRFVSAFLLAALLLTACLPGTPPATATATPSLTPTVTASLPPTATFTPSVTPSPLPPTETPTPEPVARRVLILTIDGLRPDAITLAQMPNLMALIHEGAYTFAAQTVYPSVTLPAHASLLTGMCPAKTGVTWNDYEPDQGYARGPSLFSLAHDAGLMTAMFVGKEKLRQITGPENTDVFTFINDRDLVVARQVADHFPQNFGVLFVHFSTADDMGHTYGWLSPQQLSVLDRADQALGILLKALEDAGVRSQTLIIVTADHGGHDTGHGTNLPEDMTVPWVVAGPGVRSMGLAEPVSVMDTAATAAWALGLHLPSEWDGIPVYEAFGLPDQPRPSPRCQN